MTRTRSLLALALLSACTRPAATSPDSLGPKPPDSVKRVVTLAPSLTEIVVSLGGAERIVGVTRYDQAPEVTRAIKVGGYSDPSAETIVRLAPDLVICEPSPGNKGAVQRVADSGIAVHIHPLGTLGDVTKSIERVGKTLDLEKRAAELVRGIGEARKRARAAAARRSRSPRVALLVGVDPLVAAGPGSFPHELLEDAGATDIVERSAQPYPRLSLERLVSQRPDAILLAGSGAHGATKAALPPELQGRTLELESLGFLQPGPRVVEALDELTAVLDRLATGAPP